MMSDLFSFLLSFVFNFIVAFLIVRYVYYPVKRNKNYIFTFLAFNTVIFFVLGLLSSIDLSIGVGFGLFAIFSVLRYRTNPIPIREMTYLFVLIALPVMNSILMNEGGYEQLVFANIAILIVLFLLEKGWGFHYEAQKSITYEKIELIKPQNREQLLVDLRQRTGLEITRCDIGRIDFLRDVAELKIYYQEPLEFSSASERIQGQAFLKSKIAPATQVEMLQNPRPEMCDTYK